MKLSARARRLAVAAVVITGAAASIATSTLEDVINGYLQLPTTRLDVTQPVATYHVRMRGTGSSGKARGWIDVSLGSVEQPATPIVLEVTTGAQHDEVLIDSDNGLDVPVRCDALPCSDDIEVQISLRPRSDGTWPVAAYNIQVDGTISVDGGSRSDDALTLELVP